MNDSAVGAILGAIATGMFGLVFSWISSLKEKKEKQDEHTISEILATLKMQQEKTSDFREEWGGLKKEMQLISSASVSLKESAHEVILLRRDLSTAFKKIDEIKELIKESNDYKSILNGRLFIVKKAVEDLGAEIKNDEWIDSRRDLKL